MIPLTNLKLQASKINNSFLKRLERIIDNTDFIQGKEVRDFEDELSNYTGSENAITCGNGTDALFLALRGASIEPGDIILCPSFTFIATAEVIPQVGAVPYFIDVSADDFNISIQSLKDAVFKLKKQKESLKAIISVDLFGLPVDYDSIKQICSENNLEFISDCAQSFGATYNNNSVLDIADISTTSFFPTKPLGCFGDGGSVFTSDPSKSKLIRSVAIHGKGEDKYDNVQIGINSRLDTIQAAVLLEKIKILDQELVLRSSVAKKYNERLNNDLIKPQFFDGKQSAWAQYTIILPEGIDRQFIIDSMLKNEIATGVFYPKPMHLQTAYKDFPGEECAVSIDISKRCLSLPMGPYLEDEEIEKVTTTLNSLINSK